MSFKKWNRRRWWYKFYAYWYCKKSEDYLIRKAVYEAGYLYEWQYKKLKEREVGEDG